MANTVRPVRRAAGRRKPNLVGRKMWVIAVLTCWYTWRSPRLRGREYARQDPLLSHSRIALRLADCHREVGHFSNRFRSCRAIAFHRILFCRSQRILIQIESFGKEKVEGRPRERRHEGGRNFGSHGHLEATTCNGLRENRMGCLIQLR